MCNIWANENADPLALGTSPASWNIISGILVESVPSGTVSQ